MGSEAPGTPSHRPAAGDPAGAAGIARRLLRDAAVLLPGWDVRDARALPAGGVALRVAPADGPGVTLAWTRHDGAPVDAFQVGPTHAAGWRSAPGSLDPEGPETPEEVKRLTARACQVLAQAGPEVALPAARAGEAPPPRVPEALPPGRLGAWRAAEALLADLLPAGWAVRGVERLDARAVRLDLGPEGGGPGLAVEWTDAGDAPVRAWHRGPRYAASTRRDGGFLDVDAAGAPPGLRATADALCRRLARAEGEVPLAEAPSPDGPARPVRLDPDGVTTWLAPALAVGDEVRAGWRLAEVHAHGADGVALAFRHGADRFVPRVVLRARDDAREARFRTASVDVTYVLTYGPWTEPARMALITALAGAVALRVEAVDRGVRVAAPPAAEAAPVAPPDGLAAAVAEGDAPEPALNLAIPAPCGQTCSFCGMMAEQYPMARAPRPFVEALLADIRRAAARSVRVLRINGIEPLNAPYLFELLDAAREAGFEDFHLLSTCRPLADPAFAARYVAAMPASYRVFLPLYGSRAEVHDPLTGVRGAFDALMAAVRNLEALRRPGGHHIVTTVLMRQNLHDVPAMAALVRGIGEWEVHLPHPSTSSRRDPYRDVTPTMTEALEAVYPAGGEALAELPLGEIPPCVALAHQRRTGHALVTGWRVSQRLAEPTGTFYASAGFEHSLGGERAAAETASGVATTPCPHRAACAMAWACPGKVYTLYAELHGLGELAPVDAEALEALDLPGTSGPPPGATPPAYASEAEVAAILTAMDLDAGV